MKRLLLVFLVASAGCADTADVDNVVVATPQALVSCAQPPDDYEASVSAALWVSGVASPCALSVEGSVTRGSCNVPRGSRRIVTLQWRYKTFVIAQASQALNLNVDASDGATWTIADDDIVTSGCSDFINGTPDACKNADGEENLTSICRAK
jgi:hypothetical protein